MLLFLLLRRKVPRGEGLSVEATIIIIYVASYLIVLIRIIIMNY